MNAADFYAVSWHRRLLDTEIADRAGLITGKVLDVGSVNRRYDSVFSKADSITALDRQPPISPPSVCADAADMPFEAETFDNVCSFEMFEYVPDLSRVLREIHRVLKPGGRLLFSVPFLNPVHGSGNPDDPGTDVLRYTEKGLQVLLQTWFENIQITRFGGKCSLAFDLCLLFVRDRAPVIRWVLRPFCRALGAWVRSHDRRLRDARYVMGYVGTCRKAVRVET